MQRLDHYMVSRYMDSAEWRLAVGIQEAAEFRHPGGPSIVVRDRRWDTESLGKAGFQLLHESSQPDTPACFQRESKDLKDSGFPLKTCGNDDPRLSCFVVTP
jgi:hypothetical protein